MKVCDTEAMKTIKEYEEQKRILLMHETDSYTVMYKEGETAVKSIELLKGWVMRVSSLLKKLKKTVIILSALLSICCAGLMFTACTPKDIKYDEAIAIAKNDFGCEKILWIDTGALLLSQEPGSEPKVYEFSSHYTYYAVGEKNGQEVYIIIPCNPDIEKPYLATWGLDHTFSEVVDKFNENGANYVADVPDGYYDSMDSYMSFDSDPDWIKQYAGYYNVGCDGDAFFDRLDVKGVFTYQWSDGDAVRSCMVTQENGELKAYKH